MKKEELNLFYSNFFSMYRLLDEEDVPKTKFELLHEEVDEFMGRAIKWARKRNLLIEYFEIEKKHWNNYSKKDKKFEELANIGGFEMRLGKKLRAYSDIGEIYEEFGENSSE